MIYFMQDQATSLVKIGYTGGAVEDRLKSLQTGCPGALILLWAQPGLEADEHALHARFAGLRERGEWFRPGAALLLYLLASAHQHASRDELYQSWSDGWDDCHQANQDDLVPFHMDISP